MEIDKIFELLQIASARLAKLSMQDNRDLAPDLQLLTDYVAYLDKRIEAPSDAGITPRVITSLDKLG